MLQYIFLLLINFHGVSFSIIVSSKGTLPLDKNSVAIQFFLDIKNKDQVPCRVTTKVKRCCFMHEDQDCDTMFLYGKHVENIMPGARKIFVFVHPSVFHHDKRGTCSFVIDFKCGHKHSERKPVDIAFDTGFTRMRKRSRDLKKYVGHRIIRDCDSIDENSLDDCSPVDCQEKYTDEKVFYDFNINKCVRTATCVGRIKNDLPTLVYLPTVNFCRDLEHPVQIHDIFAINNGMSVIRETRNRSAAKTAVLESNCSTISEKIGLLSDMVSGKLCPSQRGVNVDFSGSLKSIIYSILIYISAMSLSILACACSVYILSWCYVNWSAGKFDDSCRKLRRNFGWQSPIRTRTLETPGFFTGRVKTKSSVKNQLLRDVIVHDIPLELRNSVVDVCDRIGKEVKWKKRYRVSEVAAPLEFERVRHSSTDSLRGNATTSEDEKLYR